ncbi:MAG: hypothetical protein J6R07_04905, partial [Bacteroidaceae bacterium]|nr:hypothetical protein [Bacteroidaceae bacterium]
GSLKIQVTPVQMNDGEMKFVGLLKGYLEDNPDVLGDKELFLLRNKSKVGMGFFEAGNFYPDFILWIKEPGLQRISFVDPKGLMKLMPNDPKIEFYKTNATNTPLKDMIHTTFSLLYMHKKGNSLGELPYGFV